ncbi:MAG: cytochrome c oxidase subunit II [Acidimicrobiales bacterium]
MTARRHRLQRCLVVIVGTGLLAACGGADTPSTLDPKGDEASDGAVVWWLLLAAATGVLVIVGGLILWGALRRPRGNPGGLSDGAFVGIGGVALPLLVLIPVAVLTVVFTVRMRPAAGSGEALRVEIVSHQWWWEIRYPDLEIVTANELIVPTGEDVELTLTSADVIHSFWVPELAGKQDMVPGMTNQLTIRAREAGEYWGVCAEFCGTQHAGMRFVVFAREPAEFERWVDERRTITHPTGELEQRGREVFETNACAGCHAIEGTDADGTVGPDLTDFGSRATIGAGVADNTPDDLARWITDTQDVKPGANMLATDISDADLDALVAYLRSER